MNAETVASVVEEALAARHFFVAPPGRLRIERVADEQLRWEVFRGHLLDAAPARQVARFAAWHVFVGDDAPAPLISILYQRAPARVFATRQILTYGFEAYEDPPGAILSRPLEKWVRELVGTIDPERLPHDELPRELTAYVLQAVIGTSRLPITSLESPLPAFSLGQLAYLPGVSGSAQAWTDPIAMLRAALNDELPALERAKALETALRAAPPERLDALVDALREWSRADRGPDRFSELFQELFNNVALSPYTDFVDRMIEVLARLAAPDQLGAAAVADVFSYMLRHLCRHLAAFDLTVFHNFGANYPDALLLDGLLRSYLRLLEAQPDLWSGRTDRAAARRRRALRQACLARKHYEGHPVPDAPTSLGENLRVLPAPLVRVAEEQILHPARRRRVLFADDPLENVLTAPGRAALVASLADLADSAELAELGMAQFLDRPLGISKQPGEVDRTPLVSYEACSRVLAKRRLCELQAAGWIAQADRDRYAAAVDALELIGVPVSSLSCLDRPGVVSLADAQKVAADFIVLRTTRKSLGDLLGPYDLGPLGELAPDLFGRPTSAADAVLVHHVAQGRPRALPTLRIYDSRGRPRVELGFVTAADGAVQYLERAGVELVERLQVLSVWEPRAGSELVERNLADDSLWLRLRPIGAVAAARPELA